MKKIIFVLSLLSVCFVSCAKKNSTTDISEIQDITTVQAFEADEVLDQDVEKILLAGINAQSGMNKQPWHFTAITNKEVLEGINAKLREKMPKNMPANYFAKAGIADAPLVILISANEGAEFDAGLACQIMAVEATLLGYGTKILSSPNIVLNGQNKEEYKTLLGIPDGMKSCAVLLVGKYDKAKSDAITGATPRKTVDEVLSFVK